MEIWYPLGTIWHPFEGAGILPIIFQKLSDQLQYTDSEKGNCCRRGWLSGRKKTTMGSRHHRVDFWHNFVHRYKWFLRWVSCGLLWVEFKVSMASSARSYKICSWYFTELSRRRNGICHLKVSHTKAMWWFWTLRLCGLDLTKKAAINWPPISNAQLPNFLGIQCSTLFNTVGHLWRRFMRRRSEKPPLEQVFGPPNTSGTKIIQFFKQLWSELW